MNPFLLVLALGVSMTLAYQPRVPESKAADKTRRSVFLAIPLAIGVGSSSSPSVALDIDSFMAKELGSDKVEPKMSDDEALCKFGSPSRKTGEACLRAGLSTKRPTGVDAFGSVDRGNFVRCKPKYVDDPKNKGMLINVWDCQ